MVFKKVQREYIFFGCDEKSNRVFLSGLRDLYIFLHFHLLFL